MAKRKSAPPPSRSGLKGARGKTGPTGPPGVTPDVLQKILDDVIDLRRIADIQFERLAQIQAQLDVLLASLTKKRQERASKATQVWNRPDSSAD